MLIIKINTEIPKKTNRRIIDTLYKVSNWTLGRDNKDSKYNINTCNAGLIYSSYMAEQSYVNHEVLNTYAVIILDTIESKSFLKYKKLIRVYWNWYAPGALMELHQDQNKDNYYSIIYNIHDNDGGTEFTIDNKTKFFKSIESEALLFPSILYHRGMAPKENLNRFALNIIVEI